MKQHHFQNFLIIVETFGNVFYSVILQAGNLE